MPRPVLDSHFHVGVNPLSTCRPEDLIDWMDTNSVDIQMVMQVNEGFCHRTPSWNPFIGNDFIASVQRRWPDRVIGLAGVNPYHQPPADLPDHVAARINGNPALEELDRCIGELGLYGLKMHPLEHHYQINSPHIIDPMLRRLTELQSETGRPLALLIHAAGDSINNSPESIADIASRFPELLFIATHAGYKWAMPTVAHTLGPLANVKLDLTTAAGARALRPILKEYGPGKFTAGSDGPFASVECKNAIVATLTEDAEEQALILGGNLAKHFGLADR